MKGRYGWLAWMVVQAIVAWLERLETGAGNHASWCKLDRMDYVMLWSYRVRKVVRHRWHYGLEFGLRL